MSSTSRAFNIRSKGLYKKGNTLYRMFAAKVAVIVQPDDGQIQGYTSHSDKDWLALHQFLSSVGMRHENLFGPDNFDTVADRFGDSQPASDSSYSSGTNTSTSSSDTTYTEEDRFLAEIMSSLAEVDRPTVTQLAPIAGMSPPFPLAISGTPGPVTSPTTLTDTLPPLILPTIGGPGTPTIRDECPRGINSNSTTSNQHSRPKAARKRKAALGPGAVSRKRKADTSLESGRKRRAATGEKWRGQMITRSQGGSD